ncbi:MAG: methionyl-tRNA formyltransferase [Deltaproteobacteria bacterium]|nr:methionyl-tRNA formyltransferase [Deltaproteobacteria bacterium]
MINRINRVIFMGTPDFAVPSLQALLDHNENVVAVVTQPDRPKGRGRKLAPPPVKILAEKSSIPVLQPEKIRTEEYLDTIREFDPDVIIVTAYGRILPGPLLRLPPLGTINVHGSLLPAYRGAAPVQRALLNGDHETGITIMQMDEGMDTGDILLQESLPIKEDDTSATLAVKMSKLGGSLLIEALELLRKDKLPPRKQDNHLATEAPMISKDEAEIDWKRPAHEISCLIRGLDPWPLAFTTHTGQWLRFFSPEVIQGEPTEPPGTLCRIDRDGLVIAAGHDYLLVREIQREGANRMPVTAFLQGRPLQVGLRFGKK